MSCMPGTVVSGMVGCVAGCATQSGWNWQSRWVSPRQSSRHSAKWRCSSFLNAFSFPSRALRQWKWSLKLTSQHGFHRHISRRLFRSRGVSSLRPHFLMRHILSEGLISQLLTSRRQYICRKYILLRTPFPKKPTLRVERVFKKRISLGRPTSILHIWKRSVLPKSTL